MEFNCSGKSTSRLSSIWAAATLISGRRSSKRESPAYVASKGLRSSLSSHQALAKAVNVASAV